MNRLPLEIRQKRDKALKLGHDTYMGRPCKHGHDGRRRTVSGVCVGCQKADKRKRSGVAIAWNRENRAARLLTKAKSRAQATGRAFDLDLGDIVIPDTCPVLGIPLDQPSLDRFDNNLGYVKGNVRVISLRANRLKGDATIEEVEAILRYMREG